jgi:hypothetical protein
MTHADLIAEAETRKWEGDDWQLAERLITALRAAEAREQKLREALTGIQKGAEGYENGVLRVVAEAARRALGGEP